MMQNGQTVEHAKQMMIAGLKNAHGMEQQAIEMLKRNAERLEHYPELKARAQQHLEETERQQQLVAGALEQLGESPSGLKDAAMGIAENLQMMMHAAAGDEVLKNSYTGYAFEHFEIASYSALVIMAQAAGDTRVEQVARQILEEEKQMASWLEQNLPMVVNKHLSLMGSGEAKR